MECVHCGSRNLFFRQDGNFFFSYEECADCGKSADGALELAEKAVYPPESKERSESLSALYRAQGWSPTRDSQPNRHDAEASIQRVAMRLSRAISPMAQCPYTHPSPLV